jgi:hypothetical protein
MVNNSANINRISNLLSPQIIETQKTPQHMALEIQIVA